MDIDNELTVDESILKNYRPKSAIGSCRTWLLLAVIAVCVIYRVFYYEPAYCYTSAVSYSPDGKVIAVGVCKWADAYDSKNLKHYISANEQIVKLVSAETGEVLQTIEHLSHERTFSGLAPDNKSWLSFSPDGSLLAIGHWDGDVVLWDVNTQQIRTKIAGDDRPRVRSLEFSPDGKKLAIVNHSYVEVCDVRNPQELTPMDVVFDSDDDQNGLVSSTRPGNVAFSADGSQLVIGDLDSVDVSDVESGRWLNRYEWDGPTGEMYTDPWDKRFVHVHPDGSSTSNPERTEWVAISPDGKTLAVNGYGDDPPGSVKLLEFATGKQRTRIDCSYGWMRFSPDGSLLGVGGRGGLHLIDPVGEKIIKTLGESSVVLGFDFSPEGKQVAVGDTDGKLTLWDYETGQQVWSVQTVWNAAMMDIVILIALVSIPFLIYFRKRSRLAPL